MATRKQYIVSIGIRPVAICCLTDAQKLVGLLSKVDLVAVDYRHPDHDYERPVYKPVVDEVSMRAVVLEPVPRRVGDPSERAAPKRIASRTLQLPTDPKLPGGGQKMLPGA